MASPQPSCRHTTAALSRFQRSSHTVPHSWPCCTSTRPAQPLGPFTRRRRAGSAVPANANVPSTAVGTHPQGSAQPHLPLQSPRHSGWKAIGELPCWLQAAPLGRCAGAKREGREHLSDPGSSVLLLLHAHKHGVKAGRQRPEQPAWERHTFPLRSCSPSQGIRVSGRRPQHRLLWLQGQDTGALSTPPLPLPGTRCGHLLAMALLWQRPAPTPEHRAAPKPQPQTQGQRQLSGG